MKSMLIGFFVLPALLIVASLWLLQMLKLYVSEELLARDGGWRRSHSRQVYTRSPRLSMQRFKRQ